MKVFSDKKNIVILLFVSCILLILLNVIAKMIYPDPPGAIEPAEITGEEVNTRFRQAILNYGFDESWIIPKKQPDPQADIYNYLIKVPPDVPIALLVKEITDAYSQAEAEIFVEEKKINGNNYLKIFSNDKLKLTSDFTYTAGLSRKTGYAGLILFGSEKLSQNDFTSLVTVPEQFGVVVIPSKASVQFSKKIIKEKKELIVLLNDEIKELQYKLGAGFSYNRIKDVVRTIVGTYPKAAFYLIDGNSAVYNSPAGEMIISEFAKRKIKILSTNSLIVYNGSTDEKFSDAAGKLTDQQKLIAIPAEKFGSLINELDRMRKIGFRFVNPSNAILQ